MTLKQFLATEHPSGDNIVAMVDTIEATSSTTKLLLAMAEAWEMLEVDIGAPLEGLPSMLLREFAARFAEHEMTLM